MNKQLQRKLLSYSTLATALLAVEKSANGQIVYRNLETTPNYSNSFGTYFLDLNGDGIYDFNIYCWLDFIQTTFFISTMREYGGYSIANVYIQAIGSNRFNRNLKAQSAIARSGSIISTTMHSPMTGTTGDIPLKLQVNKETYLGWVRLNISYGLTIISCAYDLTPTKSIILNDTLCNNYIPTTVISLQGSDTLVSTPSNNYQWYINGLPVTGDTSQLLVNPTNGYYKVVTTDTGNCKTQSDAVNYSICGSPISNLSVNSFYFEGGCGNVNVTTQFDVDNLANFNNFYSYVPPEGFDSIKWYINGQLFDTTASPLYSFSKTINKETSFYCVSYNQFMQCYDTSNIVYDSIYPIPTTPVITQHGDTLFATDSVNEVYTYSWALIYNNGYYFLRDTNDYFIPDSSGDYEVYIVNNNMCFENSEPFHYTSSGINILSSNDIIKVYTNEDNIYINFSTPDFLNGTIELYNIEGQKLQQQTITGTSEILNVQQYAKGIYFVAVTKNGVRRVYKVALV